ncbi:MAG TPA: slipin family protein [Elusimicrobiota bacterium]|nr:slipin family protein [Elusimicrobiota bacterium]
MPEIFEAIGPIVVVAALVVAQSIRILREYERGVIFRLGRLIGVKGPGLILLIPGADRMIKVDLRTITLEVPVQEVITRDNVPAKVNAVCYFRALDPSKAINQVQDYRQATFQIAQTTLRSVVGQADLDELLSERDKINQRLQKIIDQQTEAWGIKVSAVEVKDVQIPDQMQRAIAQQAEAERGRRAKVIIAEGELQASVKLAEAAGVLSAQPAGMQLRFLQTAQLLGGERNKTIFFPLPLELAQAFTDGAGLKRGSKPTSPERT